MEPVDYVADYAIDPDDLYDNQAIKHQALIRSVFLRKTKRWERESEFRIVRPLKDCAEYTNKEGYQTSSRDGSVYLFDFSPECIASVVFGACMSSEAKRTVYNQVRGTGINLFQACLCLAERDDAGHQGRVVLIHVDELGGLKAVLKMQPQQFSSVDGDPRKRKRPQAIKSLVELPYYGRFPGIVEKCKESLEAKRSNRPMTSKLRPKNE
jgi:hypothetical protein